jgi:hypothetical protein
MPFTYLRHVGTLNRLSSDRRRRTGARRHAHACSGWAGGRAGGWREASEAPTQPLDPSTTESDGMVERIAAEAHIAECAFMNDQSESVRCRTSAASRSFSDVHRKFP